MSTLIGENMCVIRTWILLLLAQKCYSASIEYMLGAGDNEELYDESDAVADNNNANVDARRTVDDSEEEDPSFGDIVFADASDTDYYDDSKISRNSNSTSDERYNDNTIDKSENKSIFSNNSETETTTIVSLRPEQVFFDYHYDYSESDSPNYVPHGEDSKTLYSTSKYHPLITNNKDDSFSELFNLESVADNLNFNSSSEKLEETWYVIEDYPCWDLPLIYGEIDQIKSRQFNYGKRKRRSPVFQMYPKLLKNVITGNETVEEPKPLNGNFQYNVNKWCRIAPCYGDHTMCLFPKRVTAGFCGRTYTVSVPPVQEQTAFIFALNSIRNAVASGDKSHHHPQIPHVVGATNMKKIIYDYELELMAERWLLQCLPGPSHCCSLDNAFVTQLECTKLTEKCCMEKHVVTKCSPKPECFVKPLIGCLYEWFWRTEKTINKMHISCGYIESSTFSTVQLLWAKTQKVGCAYGNLGNGDVRVVCNFSPGAPFYLEVKYLCGIVSQADNRPLLPKGNITDIEYLARLGFILQRTQTKHNLNYKLSNDIDAISPFLNKFSSSTKAWGVVALPQIYKKGWIRNKLHMLRNGTKGMVARLVTQYTFRESSMARCDSEESIFEIGPPGSKCKETENRHDALCYDFIDMVPGYRMIALIASIPLFSLILYDLFSTSMKQTS